MRISLMDGSAEGISVNLDSQRAKNLMPEFADSKSAKSTAALIGTPGLYPLIDILKDASIDGAPTRGLLALPITAGLSLASLLAVGGNQIYRIDPDDAYWLATGIIRYTAILIGTIGSVNPDHLISMAANDTYVLISPGNGFLYAYTIATGALSAPIVFDGSAGDYVAASGIVFLAGYWLCYVNGGVGHGAFQRIFYSAINAPTFASADYFKAEVDNSQLRRLIVKNGHLWVFKEKSIPIFAPSGDANDPFTPIQSATIQFGCRIMDCVVQLGDHIYWLGNDQEVGGFVVYRTSGVGAQRISNSFVESLLQRVFDASGPDAFFKIYSYGCVERGRPLYKMHCLTAKTTLIFDELTGKWHERNWWNPTTGENEAELGWVHANFNGIHVVGDRRSSLYQGQVCPIYEMSEKYTGNTVWPNPDGTAHTAGVDTFIIREWISPHIAGPNRERLFLDNIELEFETGFADANGQGSDPTVSLCVSRDAGHTFGPPRLRSIGKIGQYRKRCVFDGLGSAFDFVVKLRMTDPIRWKLISAYAGIAIGAE